MADNYSKKFLLTTNSYDCYDRIKPSTLVDLMQNTGGEHADLLHAGFSDLIKLDLIWVIVRNHMEILSHRQNVREVEVITSIAKPRLFECPRDFIIKDVDTGEVIAKSRTIWVIYNYKTKQVVDPKPFEMLITEDKGLFERVRRLPKTDEKEYEYVKDVVVSFSMIDHNKHMNNTRCLDIFLDVARLPENKVISSFQVEYEVQAYLDNLLSIYKKTENNKISIFSKIESEFWRIDAEIAEI